MPACKFAIAGVPGQFFWFERLDLLYEGPIELILIEEGFVDDAFETLYMHPTRSAKDLLASAVQFLFSFILVRSYGVIYLDLGLPQMRLILFKS